MKTNDNQKGLTGKQVLFAFVAFFTVVIVTDVVFVRLAVTSFPGEQEKKSYYQGLNYNETLAEKARQEDQGWRMQLVDVPEAEGDASVELRLIDRSGLPISAATVTGEIVRPTTERGRREIVFTASPNGVYRSDIGAIERGVWDLRLSASRFGEDEIMMSAETRIMIE
ncbi:MAG: FixH family protein [Parvularcula sp.]|nr:FixH family protein [Parvularcula sp.]